MPSGTQRSTTPFSSTEASAAPLQRKGRALIACTKCRRRKIRCIASSNGQMDAAGNRACQYCVKHKHVCEYVPVDAESTSPPSSPPTSATSPHFPPTAGYNPNSNSSTATYSLSSHGGPHPNVNIFNYPSRGGPPPSQGHLPLPQSQWPVQYPHQGYDPMAPAPPGSMPVTNGYSHMAFPTQQPPYAFHSPNENPYMRSEAMFSCQ
ncbi:hypothetical protein BDZ89DRAFT_1124971 [Hymenopellis radicata]|nr:hypothetical protein BDZ89DRAFT_1124971 [Hymenopellis radicata]